jgi:pimeloyl-ACP methyl ester carboxylesterase
MAETPKPTILILHGWGASSSSWIKVKEILEKQGYSVLTPDLPGFGQEPAPQNIWQVNDYVEWVNRFCQQNQLGYFILLGHSFGGRIAIKFSVEHGEKINKLILFSAAGITPRPKLRLWFFAAANKIGNLIFSFPLLKPVRPFVRKAVYFVSGNRDYYFLQNEVMRGTFRKTIEENLSDCLRAIKAPTWILWGEKDQLTPLADAQKIEREIVGSILVTLPGQGHNPHLKAPEGFAREIIKIIER